MRRFTLLFVAALVALTGAAQMNTTVKMHRCPSLKSQKASGVKNYMRHLLVDEQKVAADKAILEELRANAAKTIKRAGETETEEPEFNYWHNSFIYSDYTLGFHLVNMQPANVEIEGENVYVDLYGNLYPLEGKISPSSKDENGTEVCLVSFEDGQLAGRNSAGDPYYFRSINAEFDEATGRYNMSFANAPIEGYYYPDYDELYIAENAQFGIYAENAAASAPLTLSLYGDIDLLPRESLENAMLKTSIHSNDYWKESIDRDGAAIMTQAGFLIKGLSVVSDTWYLLPAVALEDGSGLSFLVYPYQYAGRIVNKSYNVPVDIICWGEDMDTGENNAYFSFTMGKDNDNNVVLASDPDDVIYFAEFGINDGQESTGEKGMGYYQLSNDLTITITDEPPLAIKGVADNAGTALSKEYFDLSGRKVAGNAKGLVIEKTRYANGKSVSRKVVK